MAAIPVLRGEISPEGILPVLSEVEERRTTGVLVFEAGALEGEVALVCGQVASDPGELGEKDDPLEVLLTLRRGRYAVYQRLPSLPVSQGDADARRGSLSVHVPADLMNYCEHAGLTGLLRLESAPSRAEVYYDRGEIQSIVYNGRVDADVGEVFGWDDGTFVVEAWPEPPILRGPSAIPEDPFESQPTIPRLPRIDETGRFFVKIVEVALSRIVEDRESRRPPVRTSPPRPPLPSPRKHDSLPPPAVRPIAKPRRDPTVKIVYVAPDAPAVETLRAPAPSDTPPPPSIRPAANVEVMPRKPPPETSKAPTVGETQMHESYEAPAPTGNTEEETTMLGTTGWVAGLVLTIFAALALLAALPPLE